MKRTFIILISAALLLCILYGCEKNKSYSDEMQTIGFAALQVADDYLAYSIDGVMAKEKISQLTDDANRVYARNKDTGFKNGDYHLNLQIQMLNTDIRDSVYNGVPTDIRNTRDNLAKSLGK